MSPSINYVIQPQWIKDPPHFYYKGGIVTGTVVESYLKKYLIYLLDLLLFQLICCNVRINVIR